jgi:hypothetical protein
MLSLLKGLRSDHTLDSKKARLELLADLPRMSPVAAVGELAAYLDSVKTAEQLPPIRALDIIEFVQGAGNPLVDQITAQFLARPRATKFEHDRVHSAVHAYCGQLVEGYRFCLANYQIGALGAARLKPHLPRIVCYALDASATQAKWALFRRNVIGERLWREIAELYLFSSEMHLADALYTNADQVHRTPTQAFVAPLMLSASAPDALLPLQIEFASQIIEQLRGRFHLSARPDSQTFYRFDLTAHAPPRRLRSDQESSADIVYFGPSSAATNLSERIAASPDQALPGKLGCNVEMSEGLAQATVRHLLRYWSIELPSRAEERRRHTEHVTVIHEFDEVVAGVGGLFLESPFVSNDEQWILENASSNGFGACVPPSSGSWLSVGSLIALQRNEGSSWGAGVVRRLASDASGNRYVGIEMLSHGGTAVTITAAKLSANGSNIPAGGVVCVLLSAEGAGSAEATLLMRPGLFSESQEVIMHAYDHRYLLYPLHLVEKGDEFDLARYRIEKL